MILLYTYDPSGQQNVCYGDSGGAALWYDGSDYVLAGVNSSVYLLRTRQRCRARDSSHQLD